MTRRTQICYPREYVAWTCKVTTEAFLRENFYMSVEIEKKLKFYESEYIY
jgi:hypothetical protein